MFMKAKKKSKRQILYSGVQTAFGANVAVEYKRDCLWERSKAGVIYNWEASNEKDVPAVCSLW